MANRLKFVLTAGSLLAASCSVTPLDSQPPATPRSDIPGTAQTGAAGTCQYGFGKGCFDGHLSSMTQFSIGGKQFFNADDLNARFQELITVDSAGKALQAGASGSTSGYQLAMVTPLDNDSFYNGFVYTLEGPNPQAGQVRGDGNFSIDDLPPGSYTLRLSKPVRFQLSMQVPTADGAPPAPTPPSPSNVTPPAPPAGATTPPAPPAGATTPPAPPAGATTPPATGATPPVALPPVIGPVVTPAPKVVTKAFCATLYVDSTVEIRDGQRIWATYNNFQLHVTDDQCSADGATTPLTLNP